VTLSRKPFLILNELGVIGMSKTFAHVALTNASREVDQTYTYKVPEEMQSIAKIGMKVLVPFGMGNRVMEAIIFGFAETCEYKRIKSISHFLTEDIHLDPIQVDLVSWIRQRYLCTYSDALQTIMPAGTSLKRNVTYKITPIGREEIPIDDNLHVFDSGESLKRDDFDEISDYRLKTYLKKGVLEKSETFETSVSDQIKRRIQLKVEREDALAAIPQNNSAQIRVINYLSRRNSAVLQAEVTKACRVNPSVIRKLEQIGFVESDDVAIFRAPKHYTRDEKSNVKLNEEQQVAFELINESASLERTDTYLLHGVTGSGKTEVYIRLAEEVLIREKQCLVLVPEISLTPQIVSKFVSRFGDQVAVFHSKLSLGERFDQWKAVQRGELNIVIGARSALFAPCMNLGLIILDEEHDNAYKSDQNPKYRAIEVAKQLGQYHSAPVVLGSATPSLETTHHVRVGLYKQIDLKNRFNDQAMPTVEIVDMRHELAMGNKTILARYFIKPLKIV